MNEDSKLPNFTPAPVSEFVSGKDTASVSDTALIHKDFVTEAKCDLDK